jgi:hypothetical protein
MTTQIYQKMTQAQTEVPGQVLRQQPVYLEDARGVLAPFHLEFVTSADVSCTTTPSDQNNADEVSRFCYTHSRNATVQAARARWNKGDSPSRIPRRTAT